MYLYIILKIKMDVLILSEAETLHSREYEWKQGLEYHCLNFCVLWLLENLNISVR